MTILFDFDGTLIDSFNCVMEKNDIISQRSLILKKLQLMKWKVCETCPLKSLFSF